MKPMKYIPLIILLLFLTACGYGFPSGESTSLPPEYRTLAINKVDHPTTFPWMEARLRSLLRDELNRRAWASWADKDKAKAWINVEVSKYTRKASVTGDKDETLRSSATITMQATVVSRGTGQVLWNSGTITADWPYYTGEEEEADNEITERAVQIMVERLSRNY
ncbi:LPS assembly lipoprotein LptE [Salidesulfovibrio onnuriiensis]|uniref:LPS assembly lipoprotein LptE n=1 Tax=Salidesulfovibrio onnuriiensis TaxID=2583823 RepID=UPI001650034A|nr:LPS assembly lipoprotein LptE [Salidesulfovibrio onnuriiensis]